MLTLSGTSLRDFANIGILQVFSKLMGAPSASQCIETGIAAHIVQFFVAMGAAIWLLWCFVAWFCTHRFCKSVFCPGDSRGRFWSGGSCGHFLTGCFTHSRSGDFLEHFLAVSFQGLFQEMS